MNGCCNEYGCKRHQPFHLMRGDFSDVWYVVTKWTDRPNGGYVAEEKHALPEVYQRELNEAFPRHADEDSDEDDDE
jgi:hypothetical protein